MVQGMRAVPRLSVLSREACDMIHQASLEILRRTGVRVLHQGALALLKETDAIITDENLVHFPPALVEWAVAQAPSRVVLCRRGCDQVVAPLERQVVNFGTGSDSLNYLDPRTGKRCPSTTADVVEAIHLVDALPELAFCMSMGFLTDLATDNPFREQYALMLMHTSKPVVFVCEDRADCEAIVAMAAAAAGGVEVLRLNPTLLLYTEPTTPLLHSYAAVDKLLFFADQRLPVVHSPAPMLGGTAPATMAGGLALGNAEVLSGLVIHQLKCKGAPFVYGQGLHHMDMKTAISVYGAPEFQLARVLVAEMGQYYGLPSWGYAGHSDSCLFDEQAAVDAAFSVLIALLTGTNLVHDVGYLESGMMTSPEMIVFSAEMIAMMRHFTHGMSIDAESLALDVIHQVGPGGDYLTHQHTLEHFRKMWMPTLFSRQRFEVLLHDGGMRLGPRLREKTLALMDEHEPEPLPCGVQQEIHDILSRG